MMEKTTLERTEAFWKRPERIVLVTSPKPDGGANIITLGWKMRTSFKPPMVAVSIGENRYSHRLIEREKEFVLAFPGESLAPDVLFCGTHSGRNVDKFAQTSLTPLPASGVRAPLIKECVANFECRLAGTLKTGDHTIFAGEVLACWLNQKPEKILLSIDFSPAYRILARGSHHLLGVIK
jgi:flavin reductase (DIM6/NTAB) family NADH-FMN oxidoreductase RutF